SRQGRGSRHPKPANTAPKQKCARGGQIKSTSGTSSRRGSSDCSAVAPTRGRRRNNRKHSAADEGLSLSEAFDDADKANHMSFGTFLDPKTFSLYARTSKRRSCPR